jgi:hypothetical protein
LVPFAKAGDDQMNQLSKATALGLTHFRLFPFRAFSFFTLE